MSMREVAVVVVLSLGVGAACEKRYGDRRPDERGTASDESAKASEADEKGSEESRKTSSGEDESAAAEGEAEASDDWAFRFSACREGAREEAGEGGSGERSADYEAFASEVREIGQQREAGEGRTRWEVAKADADACRTWGGAETGSSQSADEERGDCTVEFQREGRVAVIQRTTECGGDACTVQQYVWPQTDAKPIRVEGGDSFSQIEVLSSLDAIVFDRGFAGVSADSPVSEGRNELGGGMPRVLLRSRLGSGEACVLATCFSPTVAPDGKTVLCRTKGYGVRAISPWGGFGTSREVASADDVAGEPHVRVQWGEFASPVEFLDGRSFRYEIVTEDAGDGGSGEPKRVTRTATVPE